MRSVWQGILKFTIGKEGDERALDSNQVNDALKGYSDFFDEKDGSAKEKNEDRVESNQIVAKYYYDLVTDFYEYGWGKCFHFAPRFEGENFEASLHRHEYFLSNKMGLKAGDKVLDAGCGIMGPARNIARFSGAEITGLNINAYQVKRSTILNREVPFTSRLHCVEGDFAKVPFDDGHFDHVYSIEAFCHAPDRLVVFKEMLRVLKPGGMLGIYDWVVTEQYDEDNEKHRKIKYWIEKGNGIGNLVLASKLQKDLKDAGFETLECADLAEDTLERGNEVNWYNTFEGGCSVSQIKHTKTGRWLTQKMCDVMETLRIAPKGTSQLHSILVKTAEALEESGKLGIFTPMLYVLARKPDK